jgi:hypothetical protein
MTFISYDQPRRPYFLKPDWIVVDALILRAVLQGVTQGAALELYETGAPDLGTASA